MDWNIGNSSLFSGAGTPWGAMNTGVPTQPKYSYDPTQFKGFDNSALRDSMRQSIKSNAANGRQGIMGQMAKMNPYGASADTNRALASSGATEQNNLNTLDAQMARQSWEDQVGAMDRYNQQQQQQYQNQAGLFNNEQQGRAAPWQAIGGILGNLGGLYGAKKILG